MRHVWLLSAFFVYEFQINLMVFYLGKIIFYSRRKPTLTTFSTSEIINNQVNCTRKDTRLQLRFWHLDSCLRGNISSSRQSEESTWEDRSMSQTKSWSVTEGVNMIRSQISSCLQNCCVGEGKLSALNCENYSCSNRQCFTSWSRQKYKYANTSFKIS